MARVCTACTHEQRAAIDAALVGRDGSNRRIAAQFRLSEAAVRRHAAEHLPAKLAKAEQAREVTQADDLLKEVRALRSKSYSLLLTAEKAGDLRTALLGVREARSCLELLAKLLGELDERPVLNVVLAPEWPRLVAGLREVLAPHPAILAQVSAHLISMEREGAGAR